MTTRKATVVECDAPGCSVVRFHSRDEQADGYHVGKVLIVSDGSGVMASALFACKFEHIAPAIEAAEKAAWRG